MRSGVTMPTRHPTPTSWYWATKSIATHPRFSAPACLVSSQRKLITPLEDFTWPIFKIC